MELIKKNITLVLGLSIPVLMILLVAASIYLPGFFVKPQYNFLYASGGETYYYNNKEPYSVQNDKLVKNEYDKQAYLDDNSDMDPGYVPPQVEPKLYLYNVTKNESKEVSFAEASTLNLNSDMFSPDGFGVYSADSNIGFFPFFGGSNTDYNAKYLKGHNVSKKLNITLNGNSSYPEFRFIGWVK